MTSPPPGAHPGPPPGGRGGPTKRRRRWLWIVLGVVVALVLIGRLAPQEGDTNVAADQAQLTTTTPAPASTSPPPGPTEAPVGQAEVTEVVDGDTVKVTDPVLGAVTVRVLGIDTPETKKPGFTVGCFGPEATAHATQLLEGQRVTVTRDPGQDATDRYGRTLAYLTLPDGRDYSVVAARGGFATSYVYDDRAVAKEPEIAAAEQAARAEGAGLWGPPCNGVTDSVLVTTGSPAPTTRSTPPPAFTPPPPAGGDGGGGAYYANCSAARAAGAAPLYRGDPGFASKLDRDNDGVACE